jgi:parallel beta-helix repeat protein
LNAYPFPPIVGSSACLPRIGRGDVLRRQPPPALLLGAAAVLLQASAIGAVLPIPTDVANGDTVSLKCGAVYQGTLELNGKSNVTVRTEGDCGKARISPGRAVTGWVRYSGNIYSAPISFTPQQVAVKASAVSAAHWPNQPWATSRAGMPDGDLSGATLVVLVNQSVIQSQTLTGNSIGTDKRFYVEGKLWMLDSPGEWAVQDGRLYLWAPDGKSPEGRAWAAPNRNGINADKSRGITIDGVSIFSANDGISANESSNLKVLNTDIDNSARDGIWASGSRGLQVVGSNVSNSRRNGIDGWYSITGASIANTSVSNTGMVGMPSASDAGIMFGDGLDNRIDNVRVVNSSYHGISVLHNRFTFVLNSVVDMSCSRLNDCAAVYTSARDEQPLTLLIEGNTVTNTRGVEAIGIYLDDHANGVTVNQNTVTNNTRGLVVHNGFNNLITNNTFAFSGETHMAFSQDVGNVRNNRVTGNTFKSIHNEQTFNLEAGPNFRNFATFDYNTYRSNNLNVFGNTWDGRGPGLAHSYQGWKNQIQQDAHSVTTDVVADAPPDGSQGKGIGTAP